jgi:hypothetical protein
VKLLFLALLACSHPRPAPIEPPHVVIAPRPTCNLPELPAPIEPKVVGFPTPDEVVVSKSDMVAILDYVQAMHDWIGAAAGCLQ